ncbi:myocilin-like [Aplochiton taeniatus]
MLLQLAVALSCLVLGSQAQAQGQGRASMRRSNDHSGQCQYTFTVASPGEVSCPGSSTMPGPEAEGILARLTLLESAVSRLVSGGGAGAEDGLQEAHTQAMGERRQLQQEKETLNQQMQELQKRVDELSLEAKTLRQRPCPQEPTSGGPLHDTKKKPEADPAREFGNGAYQEMKAEVTEVPASRLLPEGAHNYTGCGELVSVGEPVLHRKADGITGKYGVWLQDPEAPGPVYTNETVWRIDTVGKDVRQLFAYESLEQLVRGFPMKVLVLPESVESTGAALYRGSLYYQRRRSRTLLRYDLAAERLVTRLDLPDAGFHGQHPYSWGGYTDIDLAVDEQGLWAIYSTSRAKGAIVLSRLDPDSLEVRRSWETNVRKNTVANAFMVCGRLYTVASYTAPDTTVNHVFDTATGEGRAIAVPFKNKYRYNSMVDYNHGRRKLYAWDNFHMITYDVRLGRPSNSSS